MLHTVWGNPTELTIVCPACHRQAGLLYAEESRVYYPVAPWCCEVMRWADSYEWNLLLDAAIIDASN